MARQGHLGDLEELVLLAVLRLGVEADGARTREELESTAGRSVSISTVYVTLMRLEEKGYVRSWMGDPDPVRGGKARRFYEVRPEGAAAVREVRDVRARMWAGVDAEPGAEGHVT
jgi:DNA-binding PadR family transcriptional regulator